MIQELETSIDVSPLRRFVEYVRAQARISALKEQVSKERKELSELPPELLRDIGVTDAQARRESNRGYDDIPQIRLLDVITRR